MLMVVSLVGSCGFLSGLMDSDYGYFFADPSIFGLEYKMVKYYVCFSR